MEANGSDIPTRLLPLFVGGLSSLLDVAQGGISAPRGGEKGRAPKGAWVGMVDGAMNQAWGFPTGHSTTGTALELGPM